MLFKYILDVQQTPGNLSRSSVGLYSLWYAIGCKFQFLVVDLEICRWYSFYHRVSGSVFCLSTQGCNDHLDMICHGPQILYPRGGREGLLS